MNKKTIATVLLLGIINILISSDVTNAYPLMIPEDENQHPVTRLPRSINSQGDEKPCTALDVILVLDASENVPKENWNQIISSIINITIKYSEHINDIRLSLVRFSTTSDIMFNLGAYSNIDNALYIISGTQYVGEKSNLAHGLRDAAYIIEAQPETRRFAQDVVVVITDGKQSEASDDLDHWLKKLKSYEPYIFSVPVTGNFDRKMLNKISSSPSNFSTIDPNEYFYKVAELAVADCIPDVVEECKALDIVIVLDASENVLREHWNQIISNIINVTISSSEHIEDVRLSLVRFSTTSDILFNLGAYSSNYNSLYMINRTQYVGEKSNLAHGLRDAKYIIEAQPATRRFAQDVVLVISDGKQNEATDQLDYWLNELKNTDAEIFSYPVTSNFDKVLLNKISSSPSHVITSDADQTQFLYQLIDLAYTDCIIEPETPLQCPGEDSGTYPYNDNCESYVVCRDYGTESAKVTIMSCPAGLLFNSNIKVCDWASNVPECIQNSQSSTSEEISSTSEAPHYSNDPTPDNSSSTEELVCPGEIDGYYSDPESCEYYYVCNLDVVNRMKCPNGLYFDIYTKVCNHPYLVLDCGQANSILL